MPHKDKDARLEYDRNYYREHVEERKVYEQTRAKTPERKEQKRRSGAKYSAKPKTPEQKARYTETTRRYRLAHPKSEEYKKADAIRRSQQRLIDKYGMTAEQLAQMLADQGGCCYLCGSDKPGSKIGWHTDHDHKTGMVRSILCRGCNMSLGIFKDDPALLRRAADYIEKFAAIAANTAPTDSGMIVEN